MYRKMKIKRLLTLTLALLMFVTMMPTAVFAEEPDSDIATTNDLDITEMNPADTETEPSAAGAPVEEPELNPENETTTEEENGNDGEAEDSDGTAVDSAAEDENAAGNTPQKPTDEVGSEGEAAADPEVVESEQESAEDMWIAQEGEHPVISEDSAAEEVEAPVLRSAANPSRFSGDEEVRLGKESSNINGIIVRKKGGSSNSIARHWVTVDGVEYTAYCIQISKSATSGRNGGLEPSTDAGLLWILNHVLEGSDQDYAIKQQAIWAYLGQSFAIKDLAAGSRCTMTTEQLQQHLTDIVSSAQSATLSGNQELWIAYHLDNRNYYQDMVFSVAEPPPAATPTPTPFVPTPTPFVPTWSRSMICPKAIQVSSRRWKLW